MVSVIRSTRLVLPLLLFGYGAAANLTVLSGPPLPLTLDRPELLAGGLTRGFDDHYKDLLPHAAPSFGLIGALRYAVLGEARAGAVVGKDGWLFTQEEIRAPRGPEQIRLAVDHIAAIRDQLAAQGTQLLLLPLPAKIDIERDYAPDPLLSEAMAGLHADFVAALQAERIEVADPRAALLAQDGPTFFATDTHWTGLGAATAARLVASRLQRGPLTYTEGRATDKPLTGDLIRFVTEDRLAPRIGLPPETVTLRPLTASAPPTDIFGAAPVDIALIGTSYSANADWGFANALTWHLGRDVVNHAAVGTGPVAPMASYLAGAEFRAAPAKVVIWEFPVRYLTDPDLWPGPAAPSSSGDFAADNTADNTVASND